MPSSQRTKREAHGLDSQGKGVVLTQSIGTSGDPALIDVSGTFNLGETVSVEAVLDANSNTHYSFAAVADGTTTAAMATGLAALINAVTGVTASASSGQITVTPTTKAVLTGPRSEAN